MDTLVALFAEYGLLAVFFGVLIEQLGAPLPAFPFLLLAGVAAANDGVFAVKALLAAILAAMLADALWFFAGRHYGRHVLALLCRISISPDSCVRQSEASFARRGVATLVVAKFVPGLATLAPPLAGALGMRVGSFALFNLAGTALWAGSGITGGLLFHDQVELLLEHLGDLGGLALGVIGVLLALYLALRAWRRWGTAGRLARLPRVQPVDLAELIAQGGQLVIADVRAAAMHDTHGQRIPGARHLELATIALADTDDWPEGAEVVTYCACPNDASALKAAQVLGKRGWRVSVLAGGIDGWLAAGYELEVAGTAALV